MNAVDAGGDEDGNGGDYLCPTLPVLVIPSSTTVVILVLAECLTFPSDLIISISAAHHPLLVLSLPTFPHFYAVCSAGDAASPAADHDRDDASWSG